MNLFNIFSVMGCHSLKLKKINSNLLLLSVLFVNNMSKSLTSELIADSESLRTINDAHHYKYFDVKEKKEMKRAIIQGLGLKHTVDVKKVNVSQEEYARMYNVYFKHLKDKLTTDSSDNKSIPRFHIIHQKEHRTHHLDAKRRGVIQLFFSAQLFDQWTTVDHASLRMLMPGLNDDIAVRIQIHQILENDHHKIRKRYPIDNKYVYLSAKGSKWCEFDVTSAVQQWILKAPGRDLHLEINCPKCVQNDIVLKPLEPAVVNILMNTENGRERRSIDQALYYRKDRKTDCQKSSKKCCRQEMNFDLEKLGYNFIIQPKKFDAGICKGRCPPYYNAAHNHAVLQGIMWKKNKTATPRVCCAPSKLTHLEVLTVDEEDPTKLTVKDLANMVVLECACS